MFNKLYSFDFDNTLCLTPFPEEGMEIWEEKTGEKWPYAGWWGKAQSINPDIFDIPKSEFVYKEYLKAISEPDSYVILATGRLEKIPNMRKNIERILNMHNLSFDEIHLNWGGDTFDFKKTLFESLIKKTNCSYFTMYDDREDHLIRFVEWAKEQDCVISVIDSINKERLL